MVSQERRLEERERDLHALRYLELVERLTLEGSEPREALNRVRTVLHRRLVASLLDEGPGVDCPTLPAEVAA